MGSEAVVASVAVVTITDGRCVRTSYALFLPFDRSAFISAALSFLVDGETVPVQLPIHTLSRVSAGVNDETVDGRIFTLWYESSSVAVLEHLREVMLVLMRNHAAICQRNVSGVAMCI